MAHTSPHTTSTTRPPLGQLRDMDARSASFGNRVRSEGECPGIHVLQTEACRRRAQANRLSASTVHTLAGMDLEWCSQHYNAYTDFFATPDSWVEISSQPSSSSLSSANDEIVTTGLRVQHEPRLRRRRVARPGAPSTLHMVARTPSTGGTSSQDEYEESESESDRVMTSSGEGPYMANILPRNAHASQAQHNAAAHQAPHESSDDENRTAINYPIHHGGFTPQPNAFTHPPSVGHTRNASQPVPGSYFPPPSSRPSNRRSLPSQNNNATSHLPQNILSPSYNAAAHHDEALRSSLNTLLSCAAAARNLSNPNTKVPNQQTQTPARGNRVDPMSFRLIPESALPQQNQNQNQTTANLQEPTFKPTLRRTSTSTTSTSPSPATDRITKDLHQMAKRKSSSKSRRSSPAKKSRHTSHPSSSSSSDPGAISPTLLTWVVSAGVVVVLSALSFSAGYSLGREAGRLESEGFASGGGLVDFGAGREAGCAREVASRSLGLKRSLAREALQV